jgi:hypothetical protein
MGDGMIRDCGGLRGPLSSTLVRWSEACSPLCEHYQSIIGRLSSRKDRSANVAV